jgi:hypothetical protein
MLTIKILKEDLNMIGRKTKDLMSMLWEKQKVWLRIQLNIKNKEVYITL